MREFITCESTAAITLHIRELLGVAANYGGHIVGKRPSTLCGSLAAWDTKIPVPHARCTACIRAFKETGCTPQQKS